MHVVNTKVIPKIERKFDHLTFLDFRLQNEHFIESGVGFQKSKERPGDTYCQLSYLQTEQ